jgi:hypothetical protein
MSVMRNSFSAAAIACLSATALGAQGLSMASFRVAPQFVSYTFDAAGEKSTISQFAIPIAFAMPISERFSFDVATAFASATFDADGGEKSTISGLTDTQLRLNFTLPGDAILITAGINLPTGQYKVEENKIAPAGQIGNDFLAFPVSSFGNGFGGTGGVAFAKPLGTWNLGVGASFRKSFEFDAFESGSTTVTFTPATEFRVRAGLDREITGGRLILGAVFSEFGEDKCEGCAGGTTAATGARIIGQAAIDKDLGGKQLYVGGWVLHRNEGEQLGGIAPAENIEDVMVALGFNAGSLFLEPSVEARFRQIDGETGTLFYGGIRTRLQSGSLEFSPSIAIGTGSLGDVDISGLKAGMTIRVVRQ